MKQFLRVPKKKAPKASDALSKEVVAFVQRLRTVDLFKLPGVAESAVVGVPHPDFGEGVVAVVVPQPGHTLHEADLVRAIKDDLAGFKCPKRIFSVAELPRNAMGKVQKNVLRQQLSDTFIGTGS